MRTKITLNTFRRISRQEEAMIRAAMPRTAQADQAPLVAYHAPTAAEVALVASRPGSRLVRPLRATLAEVASA